MAEFPAFPLWTDAYLADTRHLSTIEHGAYLLLLMTAWRTPGCRLPNDDKLLAKFAGLHPSQWQRIKPTITSFWDEKDGWLYQGRCTDEYDAVQQVRKSQSRKAKVRWLKRNNVTDAAGSPRHMPQPCPPTPTPTPTPTYQKDTLTGPSAEHHHQKSNSPHIVHQNADFDAFWNAVPRKVGKRSAERKFRTAVKSGVFPGTITLAMMAYASYCKSENLETQFIVHPTTWLNQGRWDDDLTTRKIPTEAEKWDRAFEMVKRKLNGDDRSDATTDGEYETPLQISGSRDRDRDGGPVR